MTTPAKTYPPIPAEFRIIFWSMGDANEDGKIDKGDLFIVDEARKIYNPKADFNGDGKIDMRDYGICARNQGLTIDQEWKNTVDRETMQQQLEETTGIPNLPWYVDWILPLMQQQKTNLEAYAYWQNPAMQELVSGMKALAQFPDSLKISNVETAKEVYEYWIDTYRENVQETTGLELDKLPPKIVEIQSVLYADYNNRIGALYDAVDPSKYLMGDGSDVQIFNMANEAQRKISEFLINATTFKGISKIMTGGGLIGGTDYLDLAISETGAANLPAYINSMAMKKVLDGGLDRYYNAQWTPYIPDARTFIKAFIQQQLTQNDFYDQMQRLGYSAEWSNFMARVQTTPPSIADTLIAYRRGLIDEEDLQKLFRINGLDGDYKEIFDVRKYNDLNLGEARLLYELQLITKEQVFEVVKRNGYDAVDAEKVTAGITDYQARRFKLRYLLGLAQELGYGMIDQIMARTQALAIGYSETVVLWLIRVGEQRKRILERAKIPAAKEKLLALGDLKAAYVRGLLTQDDLRTELLERGYNLSDIEILLALQVEKQTVELAGGKMYALSVVEYLNAWRYEVINEDMLRMKLTARGLPQDEIDTLIATKKLMWGIGGSTPQGA